MKTFPLQLYILAVSLLILVTTITSPADENSAALEELRSIPPADDPNFEKGMGLAHIPELILTARGAVLNDDMAGKRIPFDQVLQALAALPKTSWTHGRCLMLYRYAPGLHFSNDDPPPPAPVVQKVLDALKAADIKVNENGLSR